MKRLPLAAVATFVAACATTTAPPPIEVAAAERVLAGDPDDHDVHAALLQLDGAARREPACAAVFAARGELNLRAARQARERGSSVAELLFVDAIADLQRALALDGAPAPARVSLVCAFTDAGRWQEALAAARDGRDAIGACGTGDDAGRAFELGRARYVLSAAQRADGDAAAALATLDDARSAFAAAIDANAGFRDACEQWLAMCLGSKGNLAFVTGDLANASTWLLDATRLRPDGIEADLGGGETVKLGLLRVGNRTMRDFVRTERFFRTAAELVPADPDLLNNAAVYARDLGVRLARAGRTADAAAMWERSYATYQRATAIAPLDVRLANDCALIAIHHLERDWDGSRRLLDDGIRIGEAMLRDAPPAGAKALQELQEAVGDCHENLALWHLKHGRDAAAAKAAATASLRWFPGDGRAGAKQHLAAAERLLQGP